MKLKKLLGPMSVKFRKIKELAAKAQADVEIYELTSQFRCSGSDDYLAWLDEVLGIQSNKENFFSPNSFEFKIIDFSSKLHNLIREKML
jgi:hypothetical protein